MVRQAVAYGLDRQAVVESLLRAAAARWRTQFMPPQVVGYAEGRHRSTRTTRTKAKQLLQEAGLTLPVEVEFWYPTDVSRPYMPDPTRNFQAFAASLEEVGLQGDRRRALRGGRTTSAGSQAGTAGALNLIGWTGDFGDPDNFVGTFFRTPQSAVRASTTRSSSTCSTRPTPRPNPAKRTALYQAGEPHDHERSCRACRTRTRSRRSAFQTNVNGYMPSPVVARAVRDRPLRRSSGVTRPMTAGRRTTRHGTARFVVRRLLLLVPILIGLSILVFVWVRALPGTPAQALLGERATPASRSRSSATSTASTDPIYVQYWRYLQTHGVRATSARASRSRRPVTDGAQRAVPGDRRARGRGDALRDC